MAPCGGARFPGPLAGPRGGPPAASRPIPASPTTPCCTASAMTTLDDHLGRGLRIEALADRRWVRPVRRHDDDAVLDADDLASGLRPPTGLVPRLLRVRAPRPGRCGSGVARRSPRRGSAPDLLLLQRVGASRTGRPGLGAAGHAELDFELEVGAVIDTPARQPDADRGEEAIGGYFIVNDWSARDLQRDESDRPARAGQGQGLRGHDRAVDRDARRAGRPAAAGHERPGPRDDRDGPTHDGRAVGRRAGPWSSARTRSARCSPGPRPTSTCGPAISSGRVRSAPAACSRSEETLGRYLEPGDEVTLAIERLGGS